MVLITERQMFANLGELSAWLIEDYEARRMFASWYNATTRRLNVSKPVITSDVVLVMAQEMFDQTSARMPG